jgi:pre-mRNA-splicing factor ATP-dependent RNA helicase DHX38/PRP16
MVASLEEEENSESSGLDEVGSNANSGTRNNVGRRYRESAASETGNVFYLYCVK